MKTVLNLKKEYTETMNYIKGQDVFNTGDLKDTVIIIENSNESLLHIQKITQALSDRQEHFKVVVGKGVLYFIDTHNNQGYDNTVTFTDETITDIL